MQIIFSEFLSSSLFYWWFRKSKENTFFVCPILELSNKVISLWNHSIKTCIAHEWWFLFWIHISVRYIRKSFQALTSFGELWNATDEGGDCIESFELSRIKCQYSGSNSQKIVDKRRSQWYHVSLLLGAIVLIGMKYEL